MKIHELLNEASGKFWKKNAESSLTFSGVKEWFDENHRDSDNTTTKLKLIKLPQEMDMTELSDHMKSIAQPGVINVARASNRTWVLGGII